MTSLRTFLDIYGEDKELIAIREYCSQDEVIALVPSLLTNVMQIKIDNTIRELNQAKSFACSPSYYFNEGFSDEDALYLDWCTRYMHLSLPFTKEQIEWMKNFDLSQIAGGVLIWHDLLECIKYVQGKVDKPIFLNDYYCDFFKDFDKGAPKSFKK